MSDFPADWEDGVQADGAFSPIAFGRAREARRRAGGGPTDGG
jgi:hypothetical protein